MKKLFAMMMLALTLAVVAGSAAPVNDLPFPGCLPCSSNSAAV